MNNESTPIDRSDGVDLIQRTGVLDLRDEDDFIVRLVNVPPHRHSRIVARARAGGEAALRRGSAIGR